MELFLSRNPVSTNIPLLTQLKNRERFTPKPPSAEDPAGQGQNEHLRSSVIPQLLGHLTIKRQQRMRIIWIFTGAKAQFPSGVFTEREMAEDWIQRHGLSGTLTAYPVDIGAYDWAGGAGHFTPKRDDQRSAEFIQRFSSATQEHYHYEHGMPPNTYEE